MKGIILAGGTGSRLYPSTKVLSKQLMPIYDKPMIYYPLSVLMLAGIREILIISTPRDLPKFKELLGDGSKIGMKFEYIIQENPDGLAQVFILGNKFIGTDDACLILGDNIYYGYNMPKLLSKAINNTKKKNIATIFGYPVNNPEKYGVVEFKKNLEAVGIEEKPKIPKSKYAVTGLYFYPNDVLKKVKKIKPSKRQELEITSINKLYLREKRLSVEIMGRGYAWLDAGEHDSLLEASTFVKTIEKRQGLKIACLEEIAFSKGYIDKKKFKELAKDYPNSQYGEYLKKLSGELN